MSPLILSQTLGPMLLGAVLTQDPALGGWCEPGVHKGGCGAAMCSCRVQGCSRTCACVAQIPGAGQFTLQNL